MASANTKNPITSSMFWAFSLGLVLFIALLLIQSTKLSNAVGTKFVGIGPLHFIELQKTAIEGGGYSVTMQMKSGIVIYFVLLLAIGAIVGYLRRQKA